MPRVVLHGEIEVQVRPNGEPERLLHGLASRIEYQGIEVTELSDRELSSVVDSNATESAGSDLGFLQSGSVYLLDRGGRWLVRYAFVALTLSWALYMLVALGLALWAYFGDLELSVELSLPLLVVTLAALGNRAAMKARARRLVREVIADQSGLDC